MASSVDAFAVLRLSEKAMPTTENSRSTVADALASPVAAPELRGGGTRTPLQERVATRVAAPGCVVPWAPERGGVPPPALVGSRAGGPLPPVCIPSSSAGRSTQYLGQPAQRRTAGGRAAQWLGDLHGDDWLPVRIYTAAAADAAARPLCTPSPSRRQPAPPRRRALGRRRHRAARERRRLNPRFAVGGDDDEDEREGRRGLPSERSCLCLHLLSPS
eukprot:CAMPEP_0185429792 /NCGR_PEP_ID=MMETSP1365-20130426/16997_1 /TAXON_ID=38817 /ORGANISM="Gephyrocapsa oceanica, Strain RCC1303" /LENGTH=216 /DNA_ID=CAMNT_0028034041 /DNA_START=222 /DNA_END=869 /DNA_ORIENTATION=+